MLADPEAPAADLQGALDNHEFRSDGILGKRNCHLCKGHSVHTAADSDLSKLMLEGWSESLNQKSCSDCCVLYVRDQSA